MDKPVFTADVVYWDQNGVNRTTMTIEAFTAHAAIAAMKQELRNRGKSRIKVRTPMPDRWHMAS